MALGQIGGLAGAIMGILSILIGWYSIFTFRRSLMRKLYTESDDK